MRVVEVGQYFVTKDTGNIKQFRSVACREHTLHRDDPVSEAKGWIQGNMRIGLVLEVTTSFRHFKYGIEIRICLWVKTILNLGSEYLMERSNMWLNQYNTTQKFMRIHKKSKYQRQKQNHNREYSLVHQQPYPRTKEDGLILSHQNKILLIRSLEESHQSSSTQSNVTEGRRWSNSILQD